MLEIAKALNAELVAIDDGVNRAGWRGWLRSGMQAVARHLPPVGNPNLNRPLSAYNLVIVGTPVWAGRCSAPVRSFLQAYGQEIHRVAYVITRSSDGHYEEVFQQMDLYVRTPHVAAVSLRPNTVGVTFWRDEFIKSVRDGKKEAADDV